MERGELGLKIGFGAVSICVCVTHMYSRGGREVEWEGEREREREREKSTPVCTQHVRRKKERHTGRDIQNPKPQISNPKP